MRISFWSLVLFFGVFNGFTRAQSVFDELEEKTLVRSVIMIRSVSQEFDPVKPWKQNPMSQGTGSGFVISGNRILTNAHNVSDNKYVEIKKQNEARRYPSRVVFIGHDCDLALIEPQDSTFFEGTRALELGDIPKINSTVQTYGFPVGGRHVSVTEGVVSRIQLDTYSHSRADSHLVIQTDAAINPGNSGGPVLQDGKVVGVAFQGLRSADNIGYMIPTTVIRHFLTDVEDGTYDGFGSVGFGFYPGLHNYAYSEYIKVPNGVEGIVVLSTMINSSVEGILKAGDVISSVDGYDIDNDGLVWIHGLKLHMSEVIEQKQIGDSVELTYYRDGTEATAEAEVALNRPVLAYWRQYDARPRYLVFAGLTFVPVSRNYLETWGRSWILDLPFYLRYLFTDSDYLNDEHKRKEYVVLSSILPDDINAYGENFVHHVVKSVNDEPIWKLGDIKEALDKDNGQYLTFEFMDMDRPFVMEASAARQRHEVILEKYGVPSPYSLEKK